MEDALFYSNDTDAHLVFLPHEQEGFEFNEATVALYNIDDESLVERPAVIETFEGRKSVVLKMTEDLLAHWGRWQAQVVFKQGDKINTSVVVKFDTLRYMLDQRPPTLRDVIKVDELYSQLVTVMDEIAGKDVISAPEIILARGGENTLGERLDKEHNEITTQLAQNVQQIDRIARDAISALDFDVVPNVEIDQSDKLQQAIDYCIQNQKVLYLPSGRILIKKPLRINNSIEIHGHNQSTYGNLSSRIMFDNEGQDVNVFTIEKDDGRTVPSVKFNHFYIGRVRNFNDDNYGSENLFAYGQKCTGIYAHVDESTFNDIVLLGFKNGIVFDSSQITEVVQSDLLMNQTQFKFINSFGAINIQNNNICYGQTTVEFDAGGYTFNYFGNHAESSRNHFIIKIGEHSNTNNSIENIKIQASNFTQHNADTESFMKVISKGSRYCYLRNVTIDSVRDHMYGGNPIVTQFENTQAEVLVNVRGSSFLCDKEISGGDQRGNIKWESDYYKINGSKWTDESHLSKNVSGINTYANTSMAKINGGIDLKGYDYTNYPIASAGRIFYNKTRNTLSFFNSDGKQLHVPISFQQTNGQPPTESGLTNGTFAINMTASKGNIFGWSYNKTANEWRAMGQVGHRESGVSPVGNYTPQFLGEEYFDTSAKTWYKAVGTTNQDWKAMTF